MKPFLKPYLVIPKLISQPTWGGDMIVKMKSWDKDPALGSLKIGQSYELFSGSKLATSVTDSSSSDFRPEVGNPDTDAIETQFVLPLGTYISLSDLVAQDSARVLGKKVVEKHGIMPLLNKINHATGNSFQLHIKTGVPHTRWKAKPESWYYFADGLVTFGIKKGIHIEDYRQCCLDVESSMKELSRLCMTGALEIDEARQQAKDYIKEHHPKQFVNEHMVEKDTLLDLSAGGIHHSWEEDMERFPIGNFLYEVQYDVMDPVSTIRAFDQGKIRSDGSIREIHVEDYFACLDTSDEINNIQNALRKPDDTMLLKNDFYSMDIFEGSEEVADRLTDSFAHLFVRRGSIDVESEYGTVHVTEGHSCFLPAGIGTYTTRANAESVVLKSYIS